MPPTSPRPSPRPPSVDLHGCRPDEALARLSRALHRARLQGSASIEVITGRGLGNARGAPVLRGQVEAWLSGVEGGLHGVRSHARQPHGGSLLVRLGLRRGADGQELPAEPERGAGLEDLGPADLGLDGWDPSSEAP
ncbi:Smr/MutS family protein [Engelhardtia mirabilis]|uniref:Smr domain protein n=1 Tax=Engelhardtia mirabilis TaxID=2528011 RepID=A0A518BQZ1_9BACT|nr:Smr domain protein [Planctomycetes bacterium Pla133]QDV03714.1 Smr domain protein [Planctomycetes bacterium Pla86]